MARYSKERPLRVFTTFSGYDSQCLALERLKEARPGFDYELVGWSEIEPNAIKAHNLLFPMWADRNYGDISKIDWDSAPDFDLFTYSSPCFVGGTLVLTYNGYTPIEEVKEGDLVLTHMNNYRKVVKPMRNKYYGTMVKLNAMCSNEIKCTGNHPFFVRKKKRVGHLGLRAFCKPEWVAAEKLNKDFYLGYAINQQSELPEWNGCINNQWGHHRRVNTLSEKFTNKAFWYLMGRYVGDGWKRESRTGKSVVICCSDRNKETLLNAINQLNIHYHTISERTVYKVVISSNELFLFVERYGYYAHGKCIDGETLALPKELLKSFLTGYIDSDGYICESEGKQKTKITTTSRILAYGVAQCVAKAYSAVPKIYFNNRPKKTIIEGREVNQRDTWEIVWKNTLCKQDKAFYEDGYIWFPIRKLEIYHDCADVYNMEVESDNSYTANGTIVHNCQDFSTAGLQKGGEEGSGTRSSLLWECRKAIVTKRPAYCMLENVKALTHKKFMPLFQRWCDELDSYGYTNHWQILNAKDYGVPQNRERVFLISVRKDMAGDFPYGYKFPKPFPLKRHLEDVLEPECDVPRSYYISEKSKAYFREHCDINMVKLLGDV